MTNTTVQGTDADTSERLYDILEQREPRTDKLPDQDTLDEVDLTLSGVMEFLVDRVVQAVATDGLNRTDRLPFEDVGRLSLWSDDIITLARYIITAAEKVAVIARGPEAACDEFPFGEYGTVKDRDAYEFWRWRLRLPGDAPGTS